MSGNGKHISYQPTGGISYDPAEPVYWDKAGLAGEILRTFEICHGCRLCFKYCDTFPDLFSLLDQKYDGDVSGIAPAETEAVLDTCFQCKLCEVQCPYTEREKHEYRLDFPGHGPPLPRPAETREGGAAPRPPARRPRRGRPHGPGQPGHGQPGQPDPHPPLVHGEGAGDPPRQAPSRLRSQDLRGVGGEKREDGGGTRGRGGAVSDLFCAEQRAAARARHPRGDGAEPGGRPRAPRGSGAAACRPGRKGTWSRCANRPGRTSGSWNPSPPAGPRSWPSTPPAP